jgi:hypothetical protein
MAEVDPRLEKRLRDLYEHIEASRPPSGLSQFEAPAEHRRRRKLTLAGGVIAAALAAGAVVVVGFSNHRLPGAGVASKPSTTSAPAGPSSPAAVSPSSSPSLSPSPSAAPDPTSGWTLYADASNSYSFRYPPQWYLAGPCTYGQLVTDTGTQLRVAPHPDTCGSDRTNDDITIDVFPAGNKNFTSTPSACNEVTTVTVDNIGGTRSASNCGSYPAVTYDFTTNGHEYLISFAWDSHPAGSDLTAELDQVMTRTWAFHG